MARNLCAITVLAFIMLNPNPKIRKILIKFCMRRPKISRYYKWADGTLAILHNSYRLGRISGSFLILTTNQLIVIQSLNLSTTALKDWKSVDGLCSYPALTELRIQVCYLYVGMHLYSSTEQNILIHKYIT